MAGGAGGIWWNATCPFSLRPQWKGPQRVIHKSGREVGASVSAAVELSRETVGSYTLICYFESLFIYLSDFFHGGALVSTIASEREAGCVEPAHSPCVWAGPPQVFCLCRTDQNHACEVNWKASKMSTDVGGKSIDGWKPFNWKVLVVCICRSRCKSSGSVLCCECRIVTELSPPPTVSLCCPKQKQTPAQF